MLKHMIRSKGCNNLGWVLLKRNCWWIVVDRSGEIWGKVGVVVVITALKVILVGLVADCVEIMIGELVLTS